MRVSIRRFLSTDSRHAEIRCMRCTIPDALYPAGSRGRLIAATLDSRFIRQAYAFHISRCKQSRPIATSIRRSGFTATKENCRCRSVSSDILSRIQQYKGLISRHVTNWHQIDKMIWQKILSNIELDRETIQYDKQHLIEINVIIHMSRKGKEIIIRFKDIPLRLWHDC